MAVQRVLLSVLVLLVWTCGPVDSKPVDSLISHKLIEALGLTDSSVGASPIISNLIRDNITSSLQKHEQIVLMNHTLNVYLRILDNILHQDPKSPARGTLLDELSEEMRKELHSEVARLKKKVVQLKTQYYDNKDMKTMKGVLNELDKIQVKDVLSQKKAIAEFKEIYHAASEIVCKDCPKTVQGPTNSS